MKHLFHSATLRLTAWYTLILFLISLLFSVIVFQIATTEFQRGFGPGHLQKQQLFTESDLLEEWREERLNKTKSNLVGQLILFNSVVLATGALCSYLLARRTLRPVEEAMEAQSRFSSDAAHELRTPLTIMQSEIEVGLRDKKATKQSHSELLVSSLDEVQRMRTLTDRLLLLANNHDMTLLPTSLENAAIEAVNHAIPLAQAKKIRIENTIGNLQVIGNADSLIEVLVILLDNAIKYSPAKSTITLSASAKGKHAEMRITDSGVGIAPSDLPHIFDRFYRADASRSAQNIAGHGLGLSIAKQIVTAHHGHISARPNHSGKGTTFTLTLPLA